jgi:hypothetical protein
MSVAKEILNQLGNNRFVAMTGAKNLCDCGEALSMKIARSNKINYVKITLNAMDTYDIEYGLIHGFNYTIKHESKGIYNDMLVEDFEQTTGLYTHL